MSCEWLKSRRKNKKLSQENVAEALKQTVRGIRRWENCEPEATKAVPYVELATLLEVSELELCEHHLRDLEAAGLGEHAAQARKALESLRRAQYFPPVDPAPIQVALEACAATGLPSGIGQRIDF